jgi:hypothetical protein
MKVENWIPGQAGSTDAANKAEAQQVNPESPI